MTPAPGTPASPEDSIAPRPSAPRCRALPAEALLPACGSCVPAAAPGWAARLPPSRRVARSQVPPGAVPAPSAWPRPGPVPRPVRPAPPLRPGPAGGSGPRPFYPTPPFDSPPKEPGPASSGSLGPSHQLLLQCGGRRRSLPSSEFEVGCGVGGQDVGVRGIPTFPHSWSRGEGGSWLRVWTRHPCTAHDRCAVNKCKWHLVAPLEKALPPQPTDPDPAAGGGL